MSEVWREGLPFGWVTRPDFREMASLEAFAEAFRVLRPGGRLQLGDIVVSRELSEGIRNDIDLWAS